MSAGIVSQRSPLTRKNMNPQKPSFLIQRFTSIWVPGRIFAGDNCGPRFERPMIRSAEIKFTPTAAFARPDARFAQCCTDQLNGSNFWTSAPAV